MRSGAADESSRRLPLAVGRAIFGSDAAGYQAARLGYRRPFADAVTKLLPGIVLPPSEGNHGHYSLDVEFHRTTIEDADFEAFTSHIYRRERVLTTKEVCALYASYSCVRALEDAERERMLDSIAELAERRFAGQVPNVTMTALYLAANSS